MTTLTEIPPDVLVAGAPSARDGFAQMLATLEAQLDRDLAGAATPAPVQLAAPIALPPARDAPLPRPAGTQAPPPRSMLAPAAAAVVTIAAVGFAALLVALHWRPTRSITSSLPVAALRVSAAAAATPAPAAAPGPPVLATQGDTLAPGAKANLAASSCAQVQTALGLCAGLAPRTNPTTTPESSP